MTRPSFQPLTHWLRGLLAVLLVCVLMPALAHHDIEASLPGSRLQGTVDYLVDESGQQQLADVMAAPRSAYFNSDHAVRASYDQRPYWLKINLQQLDGPGDWLLALPTTGIQDLQFFGPFDTKGKALAAPVRTGLAHPYSSRPLGSERYVFRVRLPEAGQYTAYLRLVSQTSQLYELSAWDPPAYLESRQDKRLFDGLSYGILLALLVHNLVLALVFRDRTYGYYVLSCAFALATVASFNGHAARYLLAQWPTGIELSYAVAPSLWIIFSVLFGKNFLDLVRQAPWVNRLSWVFLAVGALALMMGLGGQVGVAQRINEGLSSSAIVFFFLASLLVYRRGVTPALWYLGGQAMLFVAVLAIVLANWGLIDSPFMLANGLQVGIVMEMLVFAVALSSRIRLMRARQVELQVRAGRLARAAETDPLTGLANRSGLNARAHELLQQDGTHSLMLLDLDRFKPVNDEFGHQAGDEVLVTVAKRLTAIVRSPDTVARLGGDEFVVLVADTADPLTLSSLATRIQAALREPIDFIGGQTQIDSSLGVACFPADGKTLTELLVSADQAMYRAKQAGRGTARFFEAQRS
jgi:diguanylate cyclase (GGDEF)-like protein